MNKNKKVSLKVREPKRVQKRDREREKERYIKIKERGIRYIAVFFS